MLANALPLGHASSAERKREQRWQGWLAERLDAPVAQALDRLASADDVVRVCAMPDVHLAPGVANGVVIATRDTIYPQAVGGDIGCGMTAVAFDAAADLLSDGENAKRVLGGFRSLVPANRHGRQTARSRLPAATDPDQLSHSSLKKTASRDGRVQLGTLGRGNHFLELQEDVREGRLWLLVHSGSRAVGQAIHAHHLRDTAAGASRVTSAHVPLGGLRADSAAGRAYLADHDWAISFASANRRLMIERAAELLSFLFGVTCDWETFVDCHHNFVRREDHLLAPDASEATTLWVHRKGALSAREGELGAIPGSMGTASYHVSGRGHAPALCSSSHGAGRRLPRGEAHRRISLRTLARELSGVHFDTRLAPRLKDEAPSAYKRIESVMRAQRALTRVLRELRPLLVYKGV